MRVEDMLLVELPIVIARRLLRSPAYREDRNHACVVQTRRT